MTTYVLHMIADVIPKSQKRWSEASRITKSAFCLAPPANLLLGLLGLLLIANLFFSTVPRSALRGSDHSDSAEPSEKSLFPAQETASQGAQTTAAQPSSPDALPFETLIHEAALLHEVEPALVKAIIMVESGFDPKAVSRSGAQGLMQLMPPTAEALGVADSFDPEQNIRAGVQYLKRLLVTFNHDLKLALAAYNAGLNRVKKHGGIPPYKATQMYVRNVLNLFNHFREEASM